LYDPPVRFSSRRRKRDRSPAAARDSDFQYFIESCDADGVAGWAVHPAGVSAIRLVTPSVGEVARTERPDVAQHLNDLPGVLESGFAIRFATPLRHLDNVVIELVAGDGEVCEIERRVWPRTHAANGARAAAETGLLPLPLDVADALCELRPDTYPRAQSAWTAATVDTAVADIADILTSHAKVRPIVRYGHYLHSMSCTYRYILSHFDRVNPTPSSEIDTTTIFTSPEELLCIASHLYVLRSAGLEGGLVECGCFKGFSTCCLSHACAWLSIPMYVFDSFAGLPDTGSSYYNVGAFRGTKDEVTANLELFGRPEVVSLYEGFFSDTISRFSESFLAIWMDVDLTESATDVMHLLPRLPPRGCVFSHELPAETFVDDRPQRDSALVLPPIVDAFKEEGREPVGTHLVSYLGAIWGDGYGAPVLSYSHLADIEAAAIASAAF
jgi:hypothetical protein